LPAGISLVEIGIMLFATYGSWFAVQWLTTATSLKDTPLVTSGCVLCQGVIPFVVLSLCCRKFEHRSAIDTVGIAPRYLLRDVTLGLMITTGIMSLFILIITRAGWYHLTGVLSQQDILPLIVALIAAIGAPINEEIFFRGTLFRHLERYRGSWFALLVSSFLFGFGHSWRPYATWHSSLFLSIEVGILLAATYILTRSLWIPMGMHFAWNVCEELLYGLPDSGTPAHVSVLHATISGPDLFTGGQFGPEASIIIFTICLIIDILILMLVLRQRRKASALHLYSTWLHNKG